VRKGEKEKETDKERKRMCKRETKIKRDLHKYEKVERKKE
jgi:hypothetical protein